jgi:hypothetical protein
LRHKTIADLQQPKRIEAKWKIGSRNENASLQQRKKARKTGPFPPAHDFNRLAKFIHDRRLTRP